MKLKTAWLNAAFFAAATAGAFLLLSACGGGGNDSNDSGGSKSCLGQTIVGAALQVAEQGVIRVTLQSANGPSTILIEVFYDTVGGMTVNNPQDQFGGRVLFTSSTEIGSTITVVPNTPIGGQMMSLFPKGTPILLLASDGPQPSTTGGIGKNISINPNAQVTFGANNTVTVAFLTGGGSYTVGLTNITGVGCG